MCCKVRFIKIILLLKWKVINKQFNCWNVKKVLVVILGWNVVPELLRRRSLWFCKACGSTRESARASWFEEKCLQCARYAHLMPSLRTLHPKNGNFFSPFFWRRGRGIGTVECGLFSDAPFCRLINDYSLNWSGGKCRPLPTNTEDQIVPFLLRNKEQLAREMQNCFDLSKVLDVLRSKIYLRSYYFEN